MKRLILVFLLFAPSSFASDWKASGIQSAKTQNVYLDMSSVERRDEASPVIVRAWIKELFHLESGGLKEVNWRLSLAAFDCSERRMAYLESVAYNKNGEVLSSVAAQSVGDIEFTNYPPDSLGEGIIKFVCLESEN